MYSEKEKGGEEISLLWLATNTKNAVDAKNTTAQYTRPALNAENNALEPSLHE